MDLPVITEATNEFFRAVYADAELGTIFRGKNMLVLRKHTAYMINELAQYDLPMPSRQVEQLNRIHRKVITKYKTTKRHFMRMQSFLMEALEASGAEPEHVMQLKAKLLPLSDVFPDDDSSDASTGSADGVITLEQQQQRQQLDATVEASKQQHQQEAQRVDIKLLHAQQQQEAETTQPGVGQQQQERRCPRCNDDVARAVSSAEGSNSTEQQPQQKGGWCCFAAKADM